MDATHVSGTVANYPAQTVALQRIRRAEFVALLGHTLSRYPATSQYQDSLNAPFQEAVMLQDWMDRRFPVAAEVP